jgi:adenylate kinase
MPADRAGWIFGGEARCQGAGPAPRREWRVVLLGPSGAGNGRQAELLAGKLGTCPLSMGDVIRQGRLSVIRSRAMAGVLDRMEGGELVPDHLVLALIGERHGCLRCPAGHGFVLDGFPRTLAQAQELDRMLHARQVMLDAVVSYHLPIDNPADPLLAFYRRRGLLVSISPAGTPDEILARTLSAPPFCDTSAP